MEVRNKEDLHDNSLLAITIFKKPLSLTLALPRTRARVCVSLLAALRTQNYLAIYHFMTFKAKPEGRNKQFVGGYASVLCVGVGG